MKKISRYTGKPIEIGKRLDEDKKEAMARNAVIFLAQHRKRYTSDFFRLSQKIEELNQRVKSKPVSSITNVVNFWLHSDKMR